MIKLLTLAEIAKQLNMPASTVRHYKDIFGDYMPGVKSGRYMKYHPEAVEVIRTIAEAYKNNLQQQEITELLQEEFALNIEENETGLTATTATTANYQQEDIDFLRDLVKRQAVIIEELSRNQYRRRSWWPWRKGKH